VTAPIVGARTLAHLEDALGCFDVDLSPEERARLEAPAPPPEIYPQRMLAQQQGLEHLTRPLR
jgi:aryl-alcohol dehydrogenase-like predicted oxidoreductase